MDTGKNIWIQKSSRVIKGLIVSYLVSGAGLLLLALLLLKYQLMREKCPLVFWLFIFYPDYREEFIWEKQQKEKDICGE